MAPPERPRYRDSNVPPLPQSTDQNIDQHTESGWKPDPAAAENISLVSVSSSSCPIPSQKLLLPFEGTDTDTVWRFDLPKAANPFDYSTIADVLLTLEYTALNGFDYRQQVIQTLDP